MFYGSGNPITTSTQAEATNPSTSVLLAEIQGLAGNETNSASKLYEARVLVGASTLATFLVEQCLSSGLGSTALQTAALSLGRRTLYATVNQTAQYALRFTAQPGDRLRVRAASAITGTASATLQVEPLV